MKTGFVGFMAILCVAALAGCATLEETKISQPYVMETERADQVVDGNRGYLKGTVPPAEDRTGRKRPFIALDIDLPPTSEEAGIPETRMVNVAEEETPQAAEENIK